MKRQQVSVVNFDQKGVKICILCDLGPKPQPLVNPIQAGGGGGGGGKKPPQKKKK
jgi:hypothetical protein